MAPQIVGTYVVNQYGIYVLDQDNATPPGEALFIETTSGINGNDKFHEMFGRKGYEDFIFIEHRGQRFYKIYNNEGMTYLDLLPFIEEFGIVPSEGFMKTLERRRAAAKSATAVEADGDGASAKGAARAQKKLEKRMAKAERMQRMPGGIKSGEAPIEKPERAVAERRSRSEAATSPIVTGILEGQLLPYSVEDNGAFAAFAKEIGLAARTDEVDCKISGTGSVCKYVEDGRKKVHEGRKIFDEATVTDIGRVWMTLNYEDKTWYVKSWSGNPTAIFSVPARS